MLRHILRLLPHSSRASNKFSPVFRQRTIVAPLRPSLFIVYLGVSVATYATIITIHGDVSQAPAGQPKEVDKTVQMPRSSFYEHLHPQEKLPSPTTDETFNKSSESRIPDDIATGISRIDNILLARYVHEQCSIFSYRSYFSQ